MRLAGIALAFVACCAASGTALGECFKQPQTFYLQGEKLQSQVTLKTGDTCVHGYTSGVNVVYENVSIVERPKNGTLVSAPGLTFRYTPKKGYRGSDRYALRACGTHASKKGCTTITFVADVQ
jgi:hypothetical protein